ERKVTSMGAGFRYAPHWSPDSRKVAFIDQAMRIHVADVGSGKVVEADESPEWMTHGGLENFDFAWSPDSRWLSYSRPTGDANNAIFVYDTNAGRAMRATTGYLNDTQPTFDPEGKYLFYASDREFSPLYCSFDNSWTYPNPTRLLAVPLRKDVPSPLYARNDYEGGDDTKKPEPKQVEKEPKTEEKEAKDEKQEAKEG